MTRGGSKPGERRGGREAGTPNKSTADLKERLAALGCDPIEGMARIAMNRRVPVAVRARCFAELAQYVYPKRKAIEHTGDADNLLRIELITVGSKSTSIAEDVDSPPHPDET